MCQLITIGNISEFFPCCGFALHPPTGSEGQHCCVLYVSPGRSPTNPGVQYVKSLI